MASEPTWREAIERVLSTSSKPLHYNEISDLIISEGLRKKLGATPAASVNAQISASIKHEGNLSPFVRISKGVFALRTDVHDDTRYHSDYVQDVNDSEILQDSEDQYTIVTSFGMFWRRESVRWTKKCQLLGMQGIGATPVDFHNQLGVYLLYDGREVIYVGRSTNGSIGERLFNHTVDRFASRWDRFSWFGLLPVSDEGKIGSLPEAYVAANLIPALEAILIEALEPRQNRKRGDDLNAVEYIQKVDPGIEKKKALEILGNSLN